MEKTILEAIPSRGYSAYFDMISSETSAEAKANAARRYAEMFIDKFLSEETKTRIGKEKFNDLPLGEKIREIQGCCDDKVIESLFLIKDFGDLGSHYNPDIEITHEQAKKVSNIAISMFDLILIDHFRKNRLDHSYNTARIFSALFPKIRVNVLSELINKSSIYSKYDKEVFHKYIIALVKNKQKNKADRLLKEYLKKGKISKTTFEIEKMAAYKIYEGMEKGELPIANNIRDCRRNFDKVISTVPEDELIINSELIKMFNALLDQVEPSELGNCLPDKRYEFELEVNYDEFIDYMNGN